MYAVTTAVLESPSKNPKARYITAVLQPRILYAVLGLLIALLLGLFVSSSVALEPRRPRIRSRAKVLGTTTVHQRHRNNRGLNKQHRTIAKAFHEHPRFELTLKSYDNNNDNKRHQRHRTQKTTTTASIIRRRRRRQATKASHKF